MKKGVFFFLLLSSVFFVIGCSYSPSLTKFKREDEIRFALNGDPNSFDPRICIGNTSQILARALFDGITRIGTDGQAVLSLATSYTLSDDATKYTFFLRPSKWSNGLDVTAHDFVYAWKSILDNSAPTTLAYNFFLLKNAKEIYQGKAPMETLGLKALDKLTLEVTLEHPTPYFLELLSYPLFSPICQAVVEKYPDWTTNHFVSNGPFILDQYQLKSFAILKKNPFYWDKDSVQTDVLSFAIIEDPTTAYNMFIAGALDWYGAPFTLMIPEFAQELKDRGLLRKIEEETLRWIVCNTQRKHLSSPEVRRALYLAINRASICKHLLQNEETPVLSILPKQLSFFTTSPIKENPAQAKLLLQKALNDLGFNKDSYPTFHLLVGLNSGHSLICQAIQSQLKNDLDINVQIELCESSLFLHRLFTRKFDLALASWSSWVKDPVDTLNFLKEANNGVNSTGWESAEYKRLLTASDEEADLEQRKALLRDAESLVMREMPIIPLCTESGLYTKTNITGEVFSTIGELDLKEIKREG